MLLNPSGANTLALFTPHHNLVWDLRQPSTGKRLGIASQRQPKGLECSWGGTVAGTVKDYSSTGTGAPWSLFLSPLQPNKGSGPAHSMPQLGLRSEPGGLRGNTWSSCSGRAQGAWDVVQVGRWWPLLVLSQVVQQEITCMPRSIFQPVSALTLSLTPQPCKRSEMNIWEKGCD